MILAFDVNFVHLMVLLSLVVKMFKSVKFLTSLYMQFKLVKFLTSLYMHIVLAYIAT